MKSGSIESINVSGGGVPKLPVARAVVSVHGVEGDSQADKRHHGGPDRAVCVYSWELIEALRAEGHPIDPGAAGENLTIAGLDWQTIMPGTRLRAGTALLEVTSYTVPCRTIRRAFIEERFTRISQQTNPGWSRVYARVLVEGEVSRGDSISIVEGVNGTDGTVPALRKYEDSSADPAL